MGPTYYSSRTCAHWLVGSMVLLSGPFIFLKILCFFPYLIIQNIFNYSLYIKIITRFCISRSHVVALLFFILCFHFANSQNITELFIIANLIFFPTKINNQCKPMHKLYLLTLKNSEFLKKYYMYLCTKILGLPRSQTICLFTLTFRFDSIHMLLPRNSSFSLLL